MTRASLALRAGVAVSATLLLGACAAEDASPDEGAPSYLGADAGRAEHDDGGADASDGTADGDAGADPRAAEMHRRAEGASNGVEPARCRPAERFDTFETC